MVASNERQKVVRVCPACPTLNTALSHALAGVVWPKGACSLHTGVHILAVLQCALPCLLYGSLLQQVWQAVSC